LNGETPRAAATGRVRLVALDMDGTLLNSAHVVTAYTKKVVARATEAGVVVALSTGRCLSELWSHLDVMPGVRYVIGESGASVYDIAQKRMIRYVPMDDAVVDLLFDKAAPLQGMAQCFIDNQSYLQFGSEEQLGPYGLSHLAGVYRAGSIFTEKLRAVCRENRGRVEKANFYFPSMDLRERFARETEGFSLSVSESNGMGWEYSPLEATKALGLEALCRYLKIDMTDTMAVGDSGNDVDMLRAAGYSVAMGNATAEARAAADALTEDCDHDGAAKAIERAMEREEAGGRR